MSVIAGPLLGRNSGGSEERLGGSVSSSSLHELLEAAYAPSLASAVPVDREGAPLEPLHGTAVDMGNSLHRARHRQHLLGLLPAPQRDGGFYSHSTGCHRHDGSALASRLRSRRPGHPRRTRSPRAGRGSAGAVVAEGCHGWAPTGLVSARPS